MSHSTDMVASVAQIFREFAKNIGVVSTDSVVALNESQNYALAVIGMIVVLSVVCVTFMTTKIFAVCCSRVTKKETASQLEISLDDYKDPDVPSRAKCGVGGRSESEDSDEGELEMYSTSPLANKYSGTRI